MIFSGLELLGEIPFRDVIIHSTVLAPDGRRMSKSLGTGIDPLDVIAQLRDGRDPVRAAQELAHPGRPVLVLGDRRGWQAREQAVERGAAHPPDGRAARRAAAGVGRGALDPRPALAGTARVRGLRRRVRLRARRRRALPRDVRRLLRLVPRGGQAAALRGRRGLADDGRARARAAAEAAAPGDAARHRGDLVAPPRPELAADRRAVARGGRRVGRACARARPGGGDDLPPVGRPPAPRRRRAPDLRRRRASPTARRSPGTATSSRSARGWRRRSSARRSNSRTSASSSARRPTSWPPSARSSSATAASSTPSRSDASHSRHTLVTLRSRCLAPDTSEADEGLIPARSRAIACSWHERVRRS